MYASEHFGNFFTAASNDFCPCSNWRGLPSPIARRCSAQTNQQQHEVYAYMGLQELKKRKLWNKNDCQHSKTRSKHMKDSKERLFITTQTHNLQILGAISFVKLQNLTRRQQLNQKKRNYCLCCLFFFTLKKNPFLCSLTVIFCSLTKGITPKMCRPCLRHNT